MMKINENHTTKVSVTLNARNVIVDEDGFAVYEVYQEDNPDFVMAVKRIHSSDMFSRTCLTVKSFNDTTSLIKRHTVYYVKSNGIPEVNKLIIDLFNKLGFQFLRMVNAGIQDGSHIRKGQTIAAWESDMTLYTNLPDDVNDGIEYDIVELTLQDLIELVEEQNESTD